MFLLEEICANHVELKTGTMNETHFVKIQKPYSFQISSPYRHYKLSLDISVPKRSISLIVFLIRKQEDNHFGTSIQRGINRKLVLIT